jgi:hypothetical protein
MVAEGALVERARLSYSTTATGPGHAAIHTGRSPAQSGIDSNGVWDASLAKEVPIVSRSIHEVFGVEGKTAGPDVLLAKTVADQLREVSPDSVTLSISHKDRSAIVSGGKSANLALWYDSALPGFTTSAAYSLGLPSWVAKFNATRPTSSAFGVWSAETPELYKELFGEDDAPGEANWHGLGTTFPHEPANSPKPEKVFLASPHSAEYLIAVAAQAAFEYDLGGDEVVDFLCLSISTTDYAGHSFSSHSWEYLDVLRKTDRALGKFVRELEARTGASIRVLLTSDHGGPKLPEALGHGGRIVQADLVAETDAAIDATLGAGDWVAAYVSPFLYLTAAGEARRADILPILEDYASKKTSLAGLISAEKARSWSSSDEALKRAVAESIGPDRTDIYVLPAPGYFADAERIPDIGKGINHGSPEDHDREVPVFLMGPNVAHQRIVEVMPQSQVASSLSAMLGVEAPTDAPVLAPLR